MPDLAPMPAEGAWNLIALLFFVWLLALALKRLPPQPTLRLAAPQFAPLGANDAAQVARELGAAYADLLSRRDER